MDPEAIRAKFGDDYVASDRTFMMGMDLRFTTIIARRFTGRRVLETCTGAGFTTIALARVAEHVVTVEIDPVHQSQARQNVEKAGLVDRVTFLRADVLEDRTLDACPTCDAALLDPDWAVSGPEHVYRFRNSNTRPPADALLARVFRLTPDVALVLPPLVDTRELDDLPEHEHQELFFGEKCEVYCLYFGALARSHGMTRVRL